jgi:type VI secretion system protein ImpH
VNTAPASASLLLNEPQPRSASSAPSEALAERTVEELLFIEPFAFRFFQAVRLLERMYPERRPVGRGGPPRSEVVRFRAHRSLSFPPSEIFELQRPAVDSPAVMTVAFLGLTGPSGVLPRHYTELLLRHEREAKGPERHALRDWLDLFNHRLISLFHRAWEKYRFYIAYERGEYDWAETDPFTRCLFSLVGLGTPSLRRRLRVSCWEGEEDAHHERVLAEIKDIALLHFGGFLAHRPRCVVALEAMLRDYFGLSFVVQQFRGQWLVLEPANQSRMASPLTPTPLPRGERGRGEGANVPSNNQLGVNFVAGDRVWDVEGKFRVRLGPLTYAQYSQYIPDLAPVTERKTFFLLVDLVRLYVGPELDFDIQLVLRAADVPKCRLGEGADYTPRLGWNTWIASLPFEQDAEDTVFDGETVRWLG